MDEAGGAAGAGQDDFHHAFGGALADFLEDLAVFSVWGAEDDGLSFVASVPNPPIERNFPKQRYAQVLGQFGTASERENVVVMPAGSSASRSKPRSCSAQAPASIRICSIA